jgi:hypothetical protein
MRFLYLEPANDWTGQTVEERLRFCAETLYTHHLINPRRLNQILTGIGRRTDRQREIRMRNRTDQSNCKLCDNTGYVDYAGFALDVCKHGAEV